MMRVLLSRVVLWFGRRVSGRAVVAAAALGLVGGAAAQSVPDPVGQFPPGFLFGTSSSAMQVEGGLHQTDWYQWETLCPKCSGESADDGPAFFDHYQHDLGSARSLLNNAIRIGIEWARIFPTEASFPDAPDAAAVAQYHQVLRLARALGLNVMVTLQHFSLPVWVQDLTALDQRRGWEDPATVQRFATWAAWCGREFGGEVDYWLTINEPGIVANAGWLNGDQPPGKVLDAAGAISALWNMLDAHAAAYDALKTNDLVDADGDGAASRVSLAHHMRAFFPVDGSAEALQATATIRYLFNQLTLDAVILGVEDRDFDGQLGPGDRIFDPTLGGRLDFVALNYYGPSVVVPVPGLPPPLTGFSIQSDLDALGFDAPKTEFGWSIYPQGLRQVIDEITAYGRQIVITENGIADRDDDQRPRYVLDHLHVLAQAIGDGIDIGGYFHWSLTDNFELASGYCPRFGLFHVDYSSPARRRVPGAGAEVYRRIIAANTVPPELFAKYPEYPVPAVDCPRQP